jgi:hypothetical protein
MKIVLVFFTLLLAGCPTIPTDAVNAVAGAGGGCVKISGVWGTGIVIVGSADKGTIKNGELTVAGDCGGISIKETKPEKK